MKASPSGSGHGTRDSGSGLHLRNTVGGGEEEGGGGGMWNQKPSRREREAEGEVKRKWKPVGRFLMPRNVGVVVKVRRFMPQRIEGGRLRRMRVEVGWVDILGLVNGGRLSIGSEGS